MIYRIEENIRVEVEKGRRIMHEKHLLGQIGDNAYGMIKGKPKEYGLKIVNIGGNVKMIMPI